MVMFVATALSGRFTCLRTQQQRRKFCLGSILCSQPQCFGNLDPKGMQWQLLRADVG